MPLTGWGEGLAEMTTCLLPLQLPLCWRTTGGFQTDHVAPQLCFGVLQLLAPTQTFGFNSNILPEPRGDNMWSSVYPHR